MQRTALLAVAVMFAPVCAFASPQAAPVVGMRAADPSRHAIVGATVTTKPGTTIEGATILIRDGVIEAVGAGIEVPAGYRVWDAKERTILPAFIEAALAVDSAELARTYARLPGAHWSELVTPQLDGGQLTLPDATAEELRKLGFAIARVMLKPEPALGECWRASLRHLQGPLGGNLPRISLLASPVQSSLSLPQPN